MEKIEGDKNTTYVLPVIAVWSNNKLEYSKVNDNLIKIIESGNNWGISILEGVCDRCGEKLKVICLIENKSEQELYELSKRLDGLPHDWLNFIDDEGDIIGDISMEGTEKDDFIF